jgi:hypothetical protein
MSTHLILPCWSSRVGATVGSLIHTLNYTRVRLLLWTPASEMPILPIVETRSPCYSTLPNVVSLRWWWCRARSLEVGRWICRWGVWNPCTIVCIRCCPIWWPGRRLGPCEEEPTRTLTLLPWGPVRCIFLFHSMIPLRFLRTRVLSTMSCKLIKSWALRA